MRLSIISTLYKTAAYLPKCVDSLLAQDISSNDYEIILVNDGSPENDLEIAESYAAEYGNIKVVSHPNKGLAGARNTGLSVATGEYLCFVDPDDYIQQNSFGRLLQQMDDEHLDMLRFNYHVVNEEYNEIAKTKDANVIDYSPCIMDGRQFLVDRLGYACYVWAFIYRRSIISENQIAFREGDYFDDTVWLPQVCNVAERVNCTDVERYYYLQRENSLVNTMSPDATKKKLDAQLVIIERLTEQRTHMDKKVQKWYQGMISKTALSILSTAAISCFEDYDRYIDWLRDYKVFPLWAELSTKEQKLKYCILNISPKLFCQMIHLKNQKG